MDIATKEAWLATIEHPKIGTFDWPGVGIIRFRGLTGEEREIAQRRIEDRKPIRAWVVQSACLNGDGPMFTAADAARIGKLDGALLDALVERIARFSGMNESAVAEAEKNSDGGQSE